MRRGRRQATDIPRHEQVWSDEEKGSQKPMGMRC